MTDNTELKRLAERVIDLEAGDGEAPIGEAWDEFEAVATPSSVLALIAESERLKVDLKSVVRLNNENADLFKEKNDQLRAEVAGLKTGYEAYERVNAELKAEVEALRKDADKWKSVKRAGDQLLSDEGGAAIWSACSRVLISVASELNSGRSVVIEEGVTIGDREIGDWRVTVERIDAALGQGEQS